jgi:predicted GTPase
MDSPPSQPVVSDATSETWEQGGLRRRRVVIMGAAGRDFHNFNMLYRDDPTTEVVAFTAAQITGIEGRRYPPSLAGRVLS